MNSRPIYFPPSYDRAAALQCAAFVGAAYDMYGAWVKQGKPRRESGFRWTPPGTAGFKFSLPLWSAESWLKVFNEAEPFGFLALGEDGTGYIVYRGTDSPHDWLDDADEDQADFPFAPVSGRVHHGFLKLFMSIRDDLDRGLEGMGPKAAWVATGHSLGSGLATLTAPYLFSRGISAAKQHYNFASPRVGDVRFADGYNGMAGETFRMVNTSDVVPQVPLPVLERSLYEHVGTSVDFTANYGSIAGNHSMTGAYQYALDHPDKPGRVA